MSRSPQLGVRHRQVVCPRDRSVTLSQVQRAKPTCTGCRGPNVCPLRHRVGGTTRISVPLPVGTVCPNRSSSIPATLRWTSDIFASEKEPPLPEHNQAVARLLTYFSYDHLPPHLQAVSSPFGELAHQLVEYLADGDQDQLRLGLTDLLRAKDACVRAALS
jgi:hypothetical protein